MCVKEIWKKKCVWYSVKYQTGGSCAAWGEKIFCLMVNQSDSTKLDIDLMDLRDPTHVSWQPSEYVTRSKNINTRSIECKKNIREYKKYVGKSAETRCTRVARRNLYGSRSHIGGVASIRSNMNRSIRIGVWKRDTFLRKRKMLHALWTCDRERIRFFGGLWSCLSRIWSIQKTIARMLDWFTSRVQKIRT